MVLKTQHPGNKLLAPHYWIQSVVGRESQVSWKSKSFKLSRMFNCMTTFKLCDCGA